MSPDGRYRAARRRLGLAEGLCHTAGVLRRRLAIGLLALLPLAVAACDEHTVSIRFEPDVGDEYRFRSDISTEVEREIDGEVTTDQATSELRAVETVVAVDDDDITVEVRIDRDQTPSRSYEVRFDRRGRLTAIDLVEGVPAEALGLDLATDLPADVASPPVGPLEPGMTWTIDRAVEVPGRDEPARVTGSGRVDSLGVEDGHDVAVIVVELRVPVRSVVDTADGRVTLIGVQTSRSRTTFDLGDGATRRDATDIHGELDVIIEPPAGVTAPPVPGKVRYDVETRTERVPAAT